MTAFAITGVTALTMSEPALVEDATIVIEDGRIASIRTRGARPDDAFDGRGLVALPGLVNAHAHTLESFLRGAGGQLPLLPWIRRTHAVMDQLDGRGAWLATRIATLEMALSGTSAYLDPEVPSDHRFETMATSAAESGLRAGVTMLLEDRGGYHEWSSRETPELTDPERDLIERWHRAGEGRVSVWLGPSVLSAVSPAFGRAIRAEADRRGLGIAFHCAEVPEDRADTMERMGVGPAAFADACGLLCERSVLTHGVDLDAEDIALMAERDPSLVHCPSSNAKLGSGVAPVPDMLEAGVNVALGTDGGSSNDSYDLFNEIRLAALIHRAIARDPGAFSATDALRLATANGARALRLDAGRLAAGALADIVLVDPRAPGFAPTANIVDSLVFAGSGRIVRHLLVGGAWIVRDGELIGVDVPALIAEAQEAASAAIAAAGLSEEIRAEWFATAATRGSAPPAAG